MKQYPLGSICIIVETNEQCAAFRQRECTIVGLPGCSEEWPDQYQIDVQGDSAVWYAKHSQLRLKKFPPQEDAWCREVMKTVLMPIPVLEEV